MQQTMLKVAMTARETRTHVGHKLGHDKELLYEERKMDSDGMVSSVFVSLLLHAPTEKTVFTNVTIRTLAPIINIMGLANSDDSLNPSRGYQFNDNKGRLVNINKVYPFHGTGRNRQQ